MTDPAAAPGRGRGLRGSIRARMLPLLLAVMGGSAVHAQVSASQNYVGIAQAVMFAGASQVSTLHSGQSGLGQLATGVLMSSASFTAQGGVVFSVPPPPSPAPQPPSILQVVPPFCDALGGCSVSVIGWNFLATGAGVTTVEFGNVSGTNVVVTSDTQIQVTVPAGIATGTNNPKGPCDVRVTNGNGTEALTGGFTYQPAVVVTPAAPKLNKPVEFKGGIGSPAFFSSELGNPIGGGLPFPGLNGSLEILPLITLVPFTQLPTGEISTQFLVTDPSVVGIPLEIQGIGITNFAPFTGSFTNSLTVVFQP